MAEGRRRDATSWALIGAGGHARVLHDVLVRSGAQVVAVSGEVRGPAWDVPVLASEEELATLVSRTGAAVALGVGDDADRTRVLDWAESAGLALPPVIATTATVAPSASLGAGAAVLEHAHVGPGARLERGVIVNTAAVVEHDALVGPGSHIAPGAVLLGAAEVGSGTLVGSGARVLPGVRIGSGVVVGAGAVVISDLADGALVVGVPARAMGATG